MFKTMCLNDKGYASRSYQHVICHGLLSQPMPLFSSKHNLYRSIKTVYHRDHGIVVASFSPSSWTLTSLLLESISTSSLTFKHVTGLSWGFPRICITFDLSILDFYGLGKREGHVGIVLQFMSLLGKLRAQRLNKTRRIFVKHHNLTESSEVTGSRSHVGKS